MGLIRSGLTHAKSSESLTYWKSLAQHQESPQQN